MFCGGEEKGGGQVMNSVEVETPLAAAAAVPVFLASVCQRFTRRPRQMSKVWGKACPWPAVMTRVAPVLSGSGSFLARNRGSKSHEI